MGKLVREVAPYQHQGITNFKKGAYDAWVKMGGRTAPSHYLPGKLLGWSCNHELPLLPKSRNEARLRFIEPITRKLDAFPDYVRYEIIPMIWDCWPCLDDRISSWLKKHQVKTAIFTSRQNAERIKKRFPEMNILVITEGIDISKYSPGKPLNEREIDLLEFGRGSNLNVNVNENCLRYVCTKKSGKFYTDEELFEMMGNSKVTIALPRCDTDTAIAGGVETLTQRYWENMLTRMVMVGRAPKELTDLIGYNPVIELDREHAIRQIQYILKHIEDYQYLVERNRKTALQLADWTLRMEQVMEWLRGLGYEV